LAEGLFELGAAAVFSFLLVRHFHGRRPSRILEIRGTVSRSIENRLFALSPFRIRGQRREGFSWQPAVAGVGWDKAAAVAGPPF